MSSKFLIVNKINIFQVPEVPKEIVPEKKVSVPIREEPEATPAPGTQLLYKSWIDSNHLHHAATEDGAHILACCLIH